MAHIRWITQQELWTAIPCDSLESRRVIPTVAASRRYLKGVPLQTLMLELGRESLATTQDYLADVRKEDEAKKAVADADFVP